MPVFTSREKWLAATMLSLPQPSYLQHITGLSAGEEAGVIVLHGCVEERYSTGWGKTMIKVLHTLLDT